MSRLASSKIVNKANKNKRASRISDGSLPPANAAPGLTQRLLSPISQGLKSAFSSLSGLAGDSGSISVSTPPVASVPQVHFKPMPQRRQRVVIDALEPRVLLSGDVNPAALVINGEITGPGQQGVYELNVSESSHLLIDSLTARKDLQWSITGPSGQVVSNNFFDTDGQYGSQSADADLHL